MEVEEQYIKAGKIAAKVREQIRVEVKPGVKAIDICERVESLTRQLGGAIAFPCNVDINHVAAHYVSPVGDHDHNPAGAARQGRHRGTRRRVHC